MALTVIAAIPVTGIVRYSPQDMVSMVVKKSVKNGSGRRNIYYGAVENMNSVICPSCGEKLDLFGTAKEKETEGLMGIPFLGGIPWNMKATQAMDSGKLEEFRFAEFEPVVKNIINGLADEKFQKGNIIKGL